MLGFLCAFLILLKTFTKSCHSQKLKAEATGIAHAANRLKKHMQMHLKLMTTVHT